MKKFILLAIIVESITALKICVETKCSIEDDKYICPNANLTFIPIAAVNSEVVDLSGNYFPQLDINDFNDFGHLRVLIFSNVTLKVIHRDAFRKLKSLEELDLSINLLRYLHPDTFSETVLQYLNLSGNTFKRLVSYQFLTPHLQKLDLSNGFLEIIPDTSFPNCSSLRRLDLSENKLKTIQMKQLLLSCPRLEELIMHNNTWSCDCDFYLMSRTPIIYNNSIALRCETDREYKYVNDTLFLQHTCEEYATKSSSEIAIKAIERANKDENVQDLILNVYGYVLFGITVLMFMCCCCKGESIDTAAAENKNANLSASYIDNFYIDDGNIKKEQIHTFEKCQVEIHQEDINEISVEKDLQAK